MPELEVVPKKFEVPIENLKSDKVANALFIQTVAAALNISPDLVGITTKHPEGDFSKVQSLYVTIPGDQPIKPALDALKALEVPDNETDQAKIDAQKELEQDLEKDELLVFVKQAKGQLADFEQRIAALEAVK